jgi:hypothetical protein
MDDADLGFASVRYPSLNWLQLAIHFNSYRQHEPGCSEENPLEAISSSLATAIKSFGSRSP